MLTKALKEGVSKTIFANIIICHRLSHEFTHAAVPQILALGHYLFESQRIDKIESPIVAFGFKINDALKKVYRCELGCLPVGLFVKKMYKKYIDAGSPRSINKWILNNVIQEFVCLTNKPVWHDNQGVIYWPIKNGNPTVFLGQFDVAEQKVYEERFIGGITVYIFGCKNPREYDILDFVTFYHIANDESQTVEEHYRDEERRYG